MTASTPELLPLIYRHLKEHGFLTAAGELQKKLSPQDEASTSTTLLDIYTTWLNGRSSKRRKNPAMSKKPSLKKAAERKKSNKTNKQSGSPNKKERTKRKKDGGKNAEEVVKPIKSDVLNKEAAGGEDSDSDSSLDEEKWKKLVREMTDTDLVKMEAFNALTAPEPKKRVRKPRAKPTPKTETPINGQVPQNAKLNKSMEEVLAKSNPTKKSRTKKAAPVPALDSSSKDEHVEAPAASVISTSKQSSKKEKRKASDQTSLEPKHKKKKGTIQNNVTTSATDGNNLVDKNIDSRSVKMHSPPNESPENTPNLQNEPKKKKKQKTENVTENNIRADAITDKNTSDKYVKMDSPKQTEPKEGNLEKAINVQTESKKKKKKKANEEAADSNVLVTSDPVNIVKDLHRNLPEDDLTSSLNSAKAEADTVMKVKKKKKKKDKEKNDRESEQAAEMTTNSVISLNTCEKTMEESSPNAAEIVHKKKKKKKDKNKEESETLQQVDTEVIDEAVFAEENTEHIVVKKKSKKKKKQSEEHLGTEDKTPTIEGCEIPEENSHPSSTPQIPGSKKKKRKLDLEKLVEADTVPPLVDIETPKKKKKTASKSKETEC